MRTLLLYKEKFSPSTSTLCLPVHGDCLAEGPDGLALVVPVVNPPALHHQEVALLTTLPFKYDI